MNTKDAIKGTMDLGLVVLTKYVGDLSDADLLTRPTGCNHLAWQLGHLIAAESQLINGVCPGKGGALPAGFAERHAKDKTGLDDPKQFNTKQEYLDLFEQVRAATLKALAELPEEQFDAPSPEHFRKMFPTVGAVFTLIGSHPLMHAGQFAVARRMLGKPVVI
jgi:hypothetical protein